MTVSLSPFAGAGWQFFDNNGNPLSGGKLYSYVAGTTQESPTYTSNSGLVANTNPIILDSSGRVSAEIWLLLSQSYKFVLKSSSDVLIGTYDNIPSATPSELYTYSSGTFTPTLVGSTTAGSFTYTVQEGNYTRLNDVISFSVCVEISAINDPPAGDISIAGLPEAANQSINRQALCVGEWSSITLPSSRINLNAYIDSNSSSISLVGTASGYASTAVTASGIASNMTIAISGSYKV